MSFLRDVDDDTERNLTVLEITMAVEVTMLLLLLTAAIIRAYKDRKKTK
jgi:hypothetical protein